MMQTGTMMKGHVSFILYDSYSYIGTVCYSLTGLYYGDYIHS